jgi:hypothetical protein
LKVVVQGYVPGSLPPPKPQSETHSEVKVIDAQPRYGVQDPDDPERELREAISFAKVEQTKEEATTVKPQARTVKE